MSDAPPTLHGSELLLGLWTRDRDAVLARFCERSGLGLEPGSLLLEQLFEHLRTGRKEPLRRLVREVTRLDRCRAGSPEREAVELGPLRGFHSAVLDALRPGLGSTTATDTLDAMVLLVRAFETTVAFFVEVTHAAARHLSERRAAELELALGKLSAAQETLVQQARLKAMGALADGVAHDVNNALNAVLLRTSLLTPHTGDAGRGHLSSIVSTVRGAAGTVQRLQEFARRREQPSRAACAPVDVAREAIELTRPHWSERARIAGRMIDVRLDAAPVSAVQADPSELRAILVDLILNAAEAMQRGGTIEVALREQDEGVRIDVRDEGPGIPPEHLKRIFEPFFTTRGPAFSGLGLAMAWGVVERLGGEIRAANRPSGGAEITLVLPRVQRVDVELPLAVSPGGRRVLLVDDDDESREALEQVLVLRGHQVERAEDGRKALALYDPAFHDAVLCDISMPHMNGIQLARSIRARNPGAIIAFLTGWGSEIEEEEREVVDAVFRKPVDLEALTRFLTGTAHA